MSRNSARAHAIESIITYELPEPIDYLNAPAGTIYAQNVFTQKEMKARLPQDIYKKIKNTLENGASLDKTSADAVASAMKEWAISKGATHYGHIFYPLTGLTAEKNDSFYEPNGNGKAITEFSGDLLIQGEPDGSSFPTGGLRSTHSARSYTAWDVTSPAFLSTNPNGLTLNIPTAFVSWSGESIDTKTPLLRSMKAINTQAQRVLKLFGNEGGRVVPTCGSEQEYFLIDRHFASTRPDILSTGRTLFGASPAKGQQFDDHYFGAINQRVQAYIYDMERELMKIGVPVKTRHNEVAPGQHELAPVYEDANVAADHQQQVMTLMQSVAEKYGLTCLLHEKPFAGINGSGKHCNYSLGSKNMGNLLEPGDTPHDNAQFLVFCAAVIQAVDKHAKLLRAAVATAGNDHRLGANEAPPAIMSIFLGDQLTDVFDQIAKMGSATSSKESGTLTVGVDVIPTLPKHSGDRNRTSPMAFTGNKFEFRAVGSRQSIAMPLTILNTIVSESLDEIAGKLEGVEDLYPAVQSVLKEIMDKHGRVIFNGDGYADAWQTEAAERGLPNLKTAADAIPELASEEAISLFDKYAVLTPAETMARREVAMEQYVMSVEMEANLVLEMGRTLILPAAIRYQGELAHTAANLKAAGFHSNTTLLMRLSGLVEKLQNELSGLEALLAHKSHDLLAEARQSADSVLPQMLVIRQVADELEGLVADDLWPLPTYQEMLFIK